MTVHSTWNTEKKTGDARVQMRGGKQATLQSRCRCVCVCVCGNTVNYAAGERALRLTRNEHRHWHSHNSSRTVVEWAISATHCQFFSHAFVHQMRQIYFDFQQLNCISSNIYVLNTNGILLYILTPFYKCNDYRNTVTKRLQDTLRSYRSWCWSTAITEQV